MTTQRGAGRGPIWILVSGQTLSQTAVVLLVTVAALLGRDLAPRESLATLPFATFVIGTAIALLPASFFMGRFGRRPGFLLGILFGGAGALVCAWAAYAGSFAGFAAGCFLTGIYQGFAQYYRFAAADAAAPEMRSRAISWVLAGGVVAAIAGPEIASRAAMTGPAPYVAPFLISAGIAAAAFAVVSFLRVPFVRATAGASSGRPLSEIMRQRVFVVAAGGAAVAFGVMTMAMVAAPLAMTSHHHGIGDAALVIQLHVLGMFVPSFFTGSLIHRFGVLRIMFAGLLLLLTHVAITISGVTLPHFVSALVVLGVGWNFLFIGGTSLLTEAYRPEERAKTQAANDLLVFGTSTVASFSSGALLAAIGWTGVNLVALPVLAIVGVVLWRFGSERARTAPQA